MLDAAKLVLPSLFPQPLWFPQALDSTRQWVRMLRFDEPDYRAAAFLDSRGIRQGMPFAVVPLDLLGDRTPADARRDAHWIFHISHVGSTLIARLLGEIDGVLAYREPQILGKLGAMDVEERDRRIPVLRALLSRTFAPEQRAVVKATSFVSEQAAALVGPALDGSKALMIGMAPERFIASRLGGNLDELNSRATGRMRRLTARIPAIDAASAMSDNAHVAAMSWAAEQCSIEAAGAALEPDRVAFVDFDAFLGDPASGLGSMALHFGLRVNDTELQSIVEGPLMGRYSKNSTRAFDRVERESSIARHLAKRSSGVTEAMRWLERVARGSPELTAAIGRYA